MTQDQWRQAERREPGRTYLTPDTGWQLPYRAGAALLLATPAFVIAAILLFLH